MRCIVARVLLTGVTLFAAGCGTQLETANDPFPDEIAGTIETPLSLDADLSEGYTFRPAAGGTVSAHGKTGDIPRPHPGLKPQRLLEESLPPPSPQVSATAASMLVGLNFGEAELLLGAPDRQEDGQPSRIWQYADTDCLVRLHFYYDLRTQHYRLLHFDVQPASTPGTNPGPRPETAENCLRTFRKRLAVNGNR